MIYQIKPNIYVTAHVNSFDKDFLNELNKGLEKKNLIWYMSFIKNEQRKRVMEDTHFRILILDGDFPNIQNGTHYNFENRKMNNIKKYTRITWNFINFNKQDLITFIKCLNLYNQDKLIQMITNTIVFKHYRHNFLKRNLTTSERYKLGIRDKKYNTYTLKGRWKQLIKE